MKPDTDLLLFYLSMGLAVAIFLGFVGWGVVIIIGSML